MNTKNLFGEKKMDSVIGGLAKEIYKRFGINSDVVLVGIKSRGVPLARWIGRKIKLLNGLDVPVGSLDINLYRDDLSEVGEQPVIGKTELPFPITNKVIILVDDVLYTGRTVRAAMEAITNLGRPKLIKLAVFIDRGFRELPIQADFIGKRIKTKPEQNVKVLMEELDGKNEVVIRG